MKIKMTVIYGEDICEDLKEAFSCSSNEEFLGAFKAMIFNELKSVSINKDDLSVGVELIED